jgi:hypothetical protein
VGQNKTLEGSSNLIFFFCEIFLNFTLVPNKDSAGRRSNEYCVSCLDLCCLIYISGTSQVPDEAVTKCTACGADFGAFVRRVGYLLLSPVYVILCI